MRIEFTASVSGEHKDLLEQFSVYSLIGSALANVSDKNEHEKLNELKSDVRYKITIEEVS